MNNNNNNNINNDIIDGLTFIYDGIVYLHGMDTLGGVRFTTSNGKLRCSFEMRQVKQHVSVL